MDRQSCWDYLGHINSNGYGTIHLANKIKRAHRISYELFVGEIPSGLILDHLCRNTACINPDHLEAVTTKVNVLRGVGYTAEHARKTHCKRGHPLSGYNLVLVGHGRGRQCRACHKMKCDEAYRRRRTALAKDEK